MNMKKITFLNIVLSTLLLLSISSCSPGSQVETAQESPSSEPAAEQVDEQEGSAAATQPSEEAPVQAERSELFVEQGGIRIYYNESIADVVSDAGSVIPAAGGEGAYSSPHPQIADFDFSPMQAHIYVASVTEYESAADFAPGLIADLSRLIEGADVFGDCVYELPLDTFYQECSHQEFVANPKRISFKNGSGVRFVSVYAIQDFAPVGNDSLLYVFQGVTDDGQYYVKAIAELDHAQLESTGEIPAEIYAAPDVETVNAYFLQFEDLLNQSEGDFTPGLDWIDSVIGSLFID
jgi:hypothetical protein